VIWVIGGVLLIMVGVAVALDGWGLGGALWRFWESRYRRSRFPLSRFPLLRNPLFIRCWFGALLVVIGAGWIYAGGA
jgi:hypothetical protein